MAAPSYIRNIAIVGATGNLGSLILKALLSTEARFNVTALTRTTSPATLPLGIEDRITILRGDYDSPSFLSLAFTGQDAVLLVLHGSALVQPQIKLIEAAAAAGVKWILPTEYGTDSANTGLTNAVYINSVKVPAKSRLETLAMQYQGIKWIGLVTNLWFDLSLKNGSFMINVTARTAKLVDGGDGKFNTTLKSTVALAVARLLSLPETSPTHPSLSDYANGFVYISSFLTSQKEILESVQRATRTKDADWRIETLDAAAYIERGKTKLAGGDVVGMVNLFEGMIFRGGMGGDYESVRGTSNAALGLPKESLDAAVREVVEGMALYF